MLNLPTEQFCEEFSTLHKCQISVRLNKQSQRKISSCYRRRGELFGYHPVDVSRNDYLTYFLLECNSEWPKATQFRINLEPLNFFTNENESKKSLWDFLGNIIMHILYLQLF